MDQLIVVTHPDPIRLDVRPIDHARTPDGAVALAYYYGGSLVARGVVPPDAVDAIRRLLRSPVSVALAATEDDDGNIDGRVCLILPLDSEVLNDVDEEEEGDNEPWRASVPQLPAELGGEAPADEERPKLALLPIGHVVRSNIDRGHPENMAADVREMLENLVSGKGQDAVQKAIDDLLNSI